jgi:glycosyltransferase involved in cell wall biosynthesis
MINEKELISVIMATYQGDDEKHFVQAVESILKQTYNNLEFILCVDGEIPEERETLIERFIEKDSRVHVIYLEQNKGPACARNIGINLARGDYLAIMDADDISMPHRLEIELTELKRTKVDIIGSSYLEFMGNIQNSVIHKLPITHQSIVKSLPYFCPMASPTVLGKVSFFKNNPYREDLRVSEDYLLWVSMVRSGAIMGNIVEPLVYYRRGSDFSIRRRGLKYVRGDLIAKFAALYFLPIYKQPFIAVFTVLSTLIVRLSPPFVFNKLRDFKHILFR